MALTERLALLVTLDANGAIKGLNDVGKAADRGLGKAESRMDQMGKKFQKAGVGMLGTSALLATGLFKAGQSAADLEQAVGGTEAVFKDASGYIDRYAKGAARNMGLSERAFREATTSIGGQLKGLGFTTDDAADKAVELTGVAADLAATYGGTTAEAVQALGAAFRGEADPAERFNLRLNQNTVNAKAVAMGLAETTSQVDAQAKAQATLALITEQSSDALGQFGREAGSASGQMMIANAQLEDAKASLGEAVAPIIADVAGSLSGLAGGFADANEASGGLLSRLATFGTIGLGAAGALSFVVGKAIDMREHLGKLAGPLKNTEGGLNRVGKAAVGLGFAGAAIGAVQLGRSMSDVTIDAHRFTEALKDTSAAGREKLKTLVALADSEGKLDESVRSLAAADTKAAVAMVDLADAAGVSDDRIRKLRTIVEDTKETTGGLGGAATDTADAINGLTGAVDKETEALEGLLDATLAQFDANLGYRNSVDDVQDSLSELTQLEKAGKRGTEEYEDKLRDTEGALLDQAAAAARMAEDTAKAAGKTFDASDKSRVYREELVRLASGLAPGSPLRNALDGYIWQLASIPSVIDTQLTLRIQEQRINIANNKLLGAFGGARADGGPVSTGRSYLVGERGPELVTMGANGYVTPNDALGGPSTIIIPVSIGGQVVERLVVDANARSVRRGYAST